MHKFCCVLLKAYVTVEPNWRFSAAGLMCSNRDPADGKICLTMCWEPNATLLELIQKILSHPVFDIRQAERQKSAYQDQWLLQAGRSACHQPNNERKTMSMDNVSQGEACTEKIKLVAKRTPVGHHT